MRDIREPDWTALTAFLLSEHAEQQGDAVQRWVAESPVHAELLATLRGTLRSGPTTSMEERALTWAGIQRRISDRASGAQLTLRAAEHQAASGGGGGAGGTSVTPTWRSRRTRWTVAMCTTVAAAAALVVALHGRTGGTGALQGAAPIQEVMTRPGQNAVVRLPDGSTVVLGAASRLRYATSFASTERDVYLDGQAFFTVTHASGWPFVVHAGSVTARVLGTRFSVRKYASDTVARVVVAQGRVTVQHAILVAGDAMVAWPSGASTITHGINVKQELAWTDGGLRFQNTPLSVAIPQLERSFGITISVGDSTLLAEPITISLHGENSRDGLQIIAAITHSRAVWSRDHVVLLRP